MITYIFAAQIMLSTALLASSTGTGSRIQSRKVLQISGFSFCMDMIASLAFKAVETALPFMYL